MVMSPHTFRSHHVRARPVSVPSMTPASAHPVMRPVRRVSRTPCPEKSLVPAHRYRPAEFAHGPEGHVPLAAHPPNPRNSHSDRFTLTMAVSSRRPKTAGRSEMSTRPGTVPRPACFPPSGPISFHAAVRKDGAVRPPSCQRGHGGRTTAAPPGDGDPRKPACRESPYLASVGTGQVTVALRHDVSSILTGTVAVRRLTLADRRHHVSRKPTSSPRYGVLRFGVARG